MSRERGALDRIALNQSLEAVIVRFGTVFARAHPKRKIPFGQVADKEELRNMGVSASQVGDAYSNRSIAPKCIEKGEYHIVFNPTSECCTSCPLYSINGCTLGITPVDNSVTQERQNGSHYPTSRGTLPVQKSNYH